MKKELSIRQLFVDSLAFVRDNIPLLTLLAFLSFAGSYLAIRAGIYQNFLMLALYGLYIYFFYFFFVSLYYEQRPILTKEKFIDSFVKMVTILAFSMFVLICGKIGINVLHSLSRYLIGFPDIYSFLRRIYIFILLNPFGKIILYLSVITLLTFSFFIPGFAWISTINGHDNSIISAYAKTHGNLLKTVFTFVILYGILPLVISFVGMTSGSITLGILYALLTVFQVIVFLHLYDFFYKD